MTANRAAFQGHYVETFAEDDCFDLIESGLNVWGTEIALINTEEYAWCCEYRREPGRVDRHYENCPNHVDRS